MNDDLAGFLNARLDEDEAAASAATTGPWEWETPDRIGEWTDHGPNLMSKTATWRSPEGRGPNPSMVLGAWGYDAWGVSIDDEDAAHIARHDPARVLREVAAKRTIIEWWQRGDPQPGDPAPSPTYEGWRKSLPGYQLLRQLAAVYSDHPDYRQEWTP